MGKFSGLKAIWWNTYKEHMKKVALFVGKILQLLWELVIEKTVPPESQIWHFKVFLCFPGPPLTESKKWDHFAFQNFSKSTTFAKETFFYDEKFKKNIFSFFYPIFRSRGKPLKFFLWNIKVLLSNFLGNFTPYNVLKKNIWKKNWQKTQI